MNSLTITLQADHERQLLNVVYSGAWDLSQAPQSFQDVLAAFAEHKLRKVLVNHRRSGYRSQRFYYSKYVTDAVAQSINRNRIGINRNRIDVPRFAYVMLEPMLDPKRFGETVAVKSWNAPKPLTISNKPNGGSTFPATD